MSGTKKWSEIRHKRQTREANILDPVHEELSPLIWDQPESTHPVLKPQHAKWIKRHIYAALTAEGYTDVEKWLHLVLTGSLTTYQYSPDSDVDISLFVDTKVFPEWSRAEMIGIMISKVDGVTLPGTPFPMQDFVVGRDMNPEDLYKPGLRSGYDVDNGRWIVPPERDRIHNVESEENGFYVYALQMADKMDRLLRYEPDKAVQFWHQIHARRQRDQKAGKGDFTESNIVYKFLANRGLLPMIAETSGEYIAKTGAVDRMFHFSPQQNRASIERYGLRPSADGHIYMIANPDEIGAYPHDEDVWEVNVSGLPINEDDETHPGPIPPERIKRIAKTAAGPDEIHVAYHLPKEIATEDAGLEPNRFPGGHKPHITIAYGEKPTGKVDVPKITFETEPAKVSKPRVSAWSDHFVNSISPIAESYGRMPMYDPSAAAAWQELAEDSKRRAEEIRNRMQVTETDDPEPYPDHHTMIDDINKGKFVVSRANSEHPIWTPQQNVDFRTVHDVLGHHPTGAGFDWEGENKACGAHFGLLTPNAQRALMTECLGQTGYAIHQGGFGPQKVGFMDEMLKPAQQQYNKSTFSHVPEGGFCHRHIRHGVYKLPHMAKKAIINQRAKFVYDPGANKLVIGEMGAQEGEKATHAQLARSQNWENPQNLMFGHVDENGIGQTYGRTVIPGVGVQNEDLGPYMMQYRTEEALRRALPGTKFTNPSERLNDKWELPGDPEVIYTGEPPVINPQEPPEADWTFT